MSDATAREEAMLRDLLTHPSRFFIDGRPVIGVSLWVGCEEYEVKCDGGYAENLKRITPAHCLCPACKDGALHASDCAVHDEPPTLPAGQCSCGTEGKTA